MYCTLLLSRKGGAEVVLASEPESSAQLEFLVSGPAGEEKIEALPQEIKIYLDFYLNEVEDKRKGGVKKHRVLQNGTW